MTDDSAGYQSYPAIPAQQADVFDGWLPQHEAPPDETTISIRLHASLLYSPFRLLSPFGEEIGNHSDSMSRYPDTPETVPGLDDMAAFQIESFTLSFTNPMPYVHDGFVLQDLSDGSNPVSHIVAGGFNDLRLTFRPLQPLMLNISSSRWDHELLIRHPEGTTFPVIKDQTQAYWNSFVEGNAWPTSYYYYYATADHRPELPWYVEDASNGERIGPNPTSAQLINWTALADPKNLTKQENADGTFALTWTFAETSTDAAFKLERRESDSEPWQTIDTFPAAETLNTTTHLAHARTALAPSQPGKTASIRVFYEYGGKRSAPSNTAALPNRDTDGDGLPDWWELAHGLNPNDPTDGQRDTDEDGVPDALEQAQGTDPNNADDFDPHPVEIDVALHTVVVDVENGVNEPDRTHIELRWNSPTLPNIQQIKFQRKAGVKAPWVTLTTKAASDTSQDQQGLFACLKYSYRLLFVLPNHKAGVSNIADYEVPLVRTVIVQSAHSETTFPGFVSLAEGTYPPTKYLEYNHTYDITSTVANNSEFEQNDSGVYTLILDPGSRKILVTHNWSCSRTSDGSPPTTDYGWEFLEDISPTPTSLHASFLYATNFQGDSVGWERWYEQAFDLDLTLEMQWMSQFPGGRPWPKNWQGQDDWYYWDYNDATEIFRENSSETHCVSAYDWPGFWRQTLTDSSGHATASETPIQGRIFTGAGSSGIFNEPNGSWWYSPGWDSRWAVGPNPPPGDAIFYEDSASYTGTISMPNGDIHAITYTWQLNQTFTTEQLVMLAESNLPQHPSNFTDLYWGDQNPWGRWGGERQRYDPNAGGGAVVAAYSLDESETSVEMIRSQCKCILYPIAINPDTAPVVMLVETFFPAGADGMPNWDPSRSEVKPRIWPVNRGDTDLVFDVDQYVPGAPLTTPRGITSLGTLQPVDIVIDPAEETVVPADVTKAGISCMVKLPAPFSEAEVQWTIEEGNGGALEVASTRTAFGFATTTLTTNKVAGTVYRVGVRLTKMIEIKEDGTETVHGIDAGEAITKTGAIVVGPGATSEITVDTGGIQSLPADGTSDLKVTATFKDEHGNPLALGSKVFWHLQGSGEVLQAEDVTRADAAGASIATAMLRAGTVPGLVQKLVIETDLARKEVTVPNTALSFGLVTSSQWSNSNGVATGRFTLTANVNAKDGTPIRWASTRGQFTSGSPTVSNGQAQATVEITGSPSSQGLAVFTAAVGHSIAKVSVPMQNGMGTPPPPLAANAGTPAKAVAGLVATVAPSNGSLTADEVAEMEHAYFQAFQTAQSSGFVSGLLRMFPLEGGGGLANQAAHANWRLRLAEFLDGQVAAIRQAAEEAGKIQIQDAEGSQLVVNPGTGQMQLLDKGNGLLLQTDFAAEVMRAIRETGGNAGWATSLEKTIRYAQSLLALKARGTAKFEAFIKAHGSTWIFGTCQGLIARFGPQVISASDFDKAIERFLPEGTARLLRSLEEFTRTVQANQTIFTGLVFEDLGTNLLKPRLNAWATSNGSLEAKMAAAAAGYQYQGLMTFATLAATLSEAQNPHAACNLVKRMSGHLVGLSISAALGSQPAKDELWRMCPFVSWDLLKEDTKQLWDAEDYFGAGSKAAELSLSIISDGTLLIPIAKGVAVTVKLTGSATTRVVQSLSKVAHRFLRVRAALTPLAIELNKTFRPAVEFFCNQTGNSYKAFRRKNIDWNRVRTNRDGPKRFLGKTNLEAAEAGVAPELSDGELVTVHHSQQSSKGPLFEASTRYHNIENIEKAPLHPYGREGHPAYPLGDANTPGTSRYIWKNVEVKDYWKWRANQPE